MSVSDPADLSSPQDADNVAVEQTRPDPWFWILGAMLAGHFLFMVSLLVHDHPELNYPWVAGDSIDWLANAFALTGEDVRYTGRPPLFPLLLAGLTRLSLLKFFPVLIQTATHVALLMLYRRLSLDFSQPVAFVAVVACGFNFSWRRFSVALMADVLATCFLIFAVLLWRSAKDRPRNYSAAGLMAGLSAVTQQTALLFPIPAVLSLLWPKRRWNSGFLWAAGFLFLLPTLAWTAIKWTAFDTLGDVLVSHWSVLSPHVDTIDHYVVSLASFLGLPLALSAIVGACLLLQKALSDDWNLFLVVLAGVVAGFFVICYDHATKRFLVYLFPVLIFAIAEALSRIRNARLFAAVSILAVATSWMPIPKATGSGFTALWPGPSIYLEMDQEPHRRGGVVVIPESARLRVAGLKELRNWSLGAQLLRHRGKQRIQPVVTREITADDRGAVFLYDPSQAAQRVDLGFRLGMELRKRTHFLPSSAFSPGFFSEHGTLTQVSKNSKWSVYRSQLAGLDDSWLIVASAGGPMDHRLAVQSKASEELGQATPQPLKALEDARRLVKLLGPEQPAVFLDDQGRDPWRLYLPFLLPNAELVYIEPERVAGAREVLNRPEEVVETDIAGSVTLTSAEFHGRIWMILQADGGVKSPAE